MNYARLSEHTVIEIIDFAPEGRFTPEIAAAFQPVPDEVAPGWTHNPDSGEWSPPPLPPEPAPLTPPTLDEARARKLAEFEAAFAELDRLRIRPAASIAKAVATDEPIPQDDATRLAALEAVAAQNRALRETVQAAESVEAVRAVSLWWPEEGV